MRMGSRLTSALRTLLHKQRVETELDTEIRSYVDAVADEKIENGISPAEARRQALAAGPPTFGGCGKCRWFRKTAPSAAKAGPVFNQLRTA
jgi:hypothetical protein